MADTTAPQFGVPQGFKADRQRLDAVRGRLAKAGVTSCLATFVDVYGVPKAKVTPIDGSSPTSIAFSFSSQCSRRCSAHTFPHT